MKVLIVDDSSFFRRMMADIVKGFAGATVVGACSSGIEALDLMAKQPVDLLLSDIVMPEMDGLELLRLVKAYHPNTKVVMVSAANRTQADVTIKALAQGAFDFIPKPEGLNIAENCQKISECLDPIINLAEQHTQPANTAPKVQPAPNPTEEAVFKPIHTTSTQVPQAPSARPTNATGSRTVFEVVTIAVSTGGPDSLQKVIPKITQNLGVPILMVQHMPPVFTASLAAHLDKASTLTVVEAKEGDIPQPNTVYIAPGGYHMYLAKDASGRGVIALNQEPHENGCRPAADVLFRSLPAIYGDGILGVVMTGLGNDGTKGMQVMKQTGAYCISQSADTCVVYGMPKAIDDAGLSNESVPLDKIGERIETLVCRNRLAVK